MRISRLNTWFLRELIVPFLRHNYVFIHKIHERIGHCYQLTRANPRFFISYDDDKKILQLDTSDALTISWVLEYIRSMHSPLCSMNDTRHKLIIDVGANDGFLSSNSYNLVRAGWDAVLFEPLPKNFNILKQLHEVIRKKENQMVLLRNFAIAPQDGTGFLKTKIADDASDMQGYLCSAEEADAVPVNTVSVGSLIENDADFSEVLNRAEYVILSIDVEGNDLDVLQAFLAAGITSHLIIIETFRFEQNTVNKLFELQGYRFIKTIHWNSIYAWGSI